MLMYFHRDIPWEEFSFLKELWAFPWDLFHPDVPSGYVQTRKSVCAQGDTACLHVFQHTKTHIMSLACAPTHNKAWTYCNRANTYAYILRWTNWNNNVLLNIEVLDKMKKTDCHLPYILSFYPLLFLTTFLNSNGQ